MSKKVKKPGTGGILLVLALTIIVSPAVLSSCQSPAVTTTIDAAALPPVFRDMERLWGDYFTTLVFAERHDRLVFGRLPERLEAEFEELTVNATLPDVPESLPVYTVNRPEVDDTYARKLTRQAGFDGELEFHDTDSTWRVYLGPSDNDETPGISIYSDGSIAVLYTRGGRPEPSGIPADSECLDIAEKWLKSHDLYPENVTDIRVMENTLAVMQGENEHKYTASKTVGFQISPGDYEIFGMGAYVTIGEEGKVLEVHINTAEFDCCGRVPIRQPDDAVALLREYLAKPDFFRAADPECLVREINRVVELESMTLVYFPMHDDEQASGLYAQPVYVFKGTGMNDPALWRHEFIALVDAVGRD